MELVYLSSNKFFDLPYAICFNLCRLAKVDFFKNSSAKNVNVNWRSSIMLPDLSLNNLLYSSPAYLFDIFGSSRSKILIKIDYKLG